MRLRLTLLCAFLIVHFSPSGGAQTPAAQAAAAGTACLDLAKKIGSDARIANTIILVAQDPSCFLEASRANVEQEAKSEFGPVRTSLLSWLEMYANGNKRGIQAFRTDIAVSGRQR
jgi:hypothetical protein